MFQTVDESDAVHPDLWAKVARLDQCCDVHFERFGDPLDRRWRVVIRNSDNPPVVAEDESLPRAMTAALLAAEARGWP